MARRPDPDADALLDVLRLRMDDGMLAEISVADYGSGADQALEDLQRIRGSGTVPVPVPWPLKEVLALFRWSEPENPEWKPGATGVRGHRMRAFACAALLRASAEPEEALYTDGENQTLAQLLASLLALGAEEQAAGLRFVRWRAAGLEPGLELPFFRLGQLILTVHLGAASASPAELIRLAAQVVEDEAAERAAVEPCIADTRWLLGLSYFQIRHPVWVALANGLLEGAAAIPDAAAREAVEEVALRVLCG